ncbi:hypothetical protein [Roseomonas chloroacetimidivorans]
MRIGGYAELGLVARHEESAIGLGVPVGGHNPARQLPTSLYAIR